MSVYAITLAFCNPGILDISLRQFHSTRNLDLKLGGHFIVDQCYPMHRPEVDRTLRTLAADLPITILRPGRNLGLHNGFNWAMGQIGSIGNNDIVIGYDGDSLPIHQGWDMALVRAIEGRRSGMNSHEAVVWSTLGNPRSLSDIEDRGYDEAVADGYLRMRLARTAVTNSVCAWRYGWLKAVGFLAEPRAFYGHLEAEMWARLRNSERWAILPDYRESDELRNLHDREYVAYKWFHSHTDTWRGDFESYLNAGCPGLSLSPAEIP